MGGSLASPRYTLDQLAVVEAVGRCGSFAGAARELHRVPSAVSYSVQSLESALGVELFDRSGHRANPTAAGRQLLEEARELLEKARRLDRVATLLADGWESELRLVVDGAYPLDPLLKVLQTFASEKIPTQVQVDVEYQDGVMERFEQDQADMMIALGLEDGGRYQGTPLPPLEMVLVVAPNHPLASACNLSREALGEYTDLLVKDSSSSYARRPRPSFLGSRQVVRLSDFYSKREALRTGVGYGWLPLHLAAEDLAEKRLVIVDLPEGNRWTYQPFLVRRRDEPPGKAAIRMASALAGSSKFLNVASKK